MAFTMLIGPFVIVGSILIGIKGPLSFHPLHRTGIVAALIAVGAYMFIGYYGSRLDRHSTEQSNRWRHAIWLLLRGNEVSDEDLTFSDYWPRMTYYSGFVALIIAFVAIVFLLKDILSSI
jgi:hypothetical protein